MKNYKFVYLVLACCNSLLISSDLTLLGRVVNGDGIGQIIPNFIEMTKNDLKFKFVGNGNTDEVNKIRSICTESIVGIKDLHYERQDKIDQSILSNIEKDKLKIFCDIPYWILNKGLSDASINIAYTMCETTEFHSKYIGILNEKFDALIVPDEYLVNIFRASGAKLPIFVYPIPVDIGGLSKFSNTEQNKKVFTFGCTAALWAYKNHMLLIRAFYEEFNKNENVRLFIHARGGEMLQEIKELIKSLNIKNVILSERSLPCKEYLELLQSFHCFVLISKGEGFSVPPREAMAFGVPCMLSNNSAHKTICDSNYVAVVPSDIKVSAWTGYPSSNIGYNFDCKIEDVRRVLRDIYNNYQKYEDMAKKGREWVQQYDFKNLKQKFINFVKPKKIILGDKNIVTNEYIMTDSVKLYNKYNNLK